MSWCPECLAEYEVEVGTCADCGVLLSRTPPVNLPPVLVYHGTNANDAQILAATLRGEGIEAFVGASNISLPQAGTNVNDNTVSELDVYVSASDAVAARAIVLEPQLSDEELTSAELSTEESEE